MGADDVRIDVLLIPLVNSRSRESWRPCAMLEGPVLETGQSSDTWPGRWPVLGPEHVHLPGPLFRPVYCWSRSSPSPSSRLTSVSAPDHSPDTPSFPRSCGRRTCLFVASLVLIFFTLIFQLAITSLIVTSMFLQSTCDLASFLCQQRPGLNATLLPVNSVATSVWPCVLIVVLKSW